MNSGVSSPLATEVKKSVLAPHQPKLKSSFVLPKIEGQSSDIHPKEALGHGIFFVRSRLEEGRSNFEHIKVSQCLKLIYFLCQYRRVKAEIYLVVHNSYICSGFLKPINMIAP